MSQNTQFFPHIFVMDGTVYYLSRTDKSRYKRREKCLDFFFGSYFPSRKEREIVGGSGVERDGCGKMRFENIYSFISGISWIRFHVFDTTFKYSYIDRNVLFSGQEILGFAPDKWHTAGPKKPNEERII